MRQGIAGPRPGGRAKLMRALAEVKPARLDPATPPPVSWPPSGHFTKLPQSRPATSTSDASTRAGGNRRPGRPRSPARPHQPPKLSPFRLKLLAAVSSATATAAALALAVTLGGSAHRPALRRQSQLSDTPIRFQRLPLIRPWHGRIEYGVRAGIVYLTGSATIQAATTTAITVLPPSIRPRYRLDIPIAVPPAALTIEITAGGRVFLLSGRSAFLTGRIWLSGVSFPVGS